MQRIMTIFLCSLSLAGCAIVSEPKPQAAVQYKPVSKEKNIVIHSQNGSSVVDKTKYERDTFNIKQDPSVKGNYMRYKVGL